MSMQDTVPARFPQTHWSLVLAGDRGLAFEHLANAYWRPVYGYMRARCGRDGTEALDLTQAFFVRLLAGDLLARADRGRGRFRAYVRAALANFLSDEWRRRNARSRGGGQCFVPLDDADLLELPDTRGKDPQAALDELWRAEVLERAARDLESELRAEGKDTWWALFQDQVLLGAELSQAELARRHGVKRVDVSNWLARSRARYRETLIRIVRETVANEESLADELAWILGEAGP
jgi:RNA polymerase sigma-70 factor (ECF subfamily)